MYLKLWAAIRIKESKPLKLLWRLRGIINNEWLINPKEDLKKEKEQRGIGDIKTDGKVVGLKPTRSVVTLTQSFPLTPSKTAFVRMNKAQDLSIKNTSQDQGHGSVGKVTIA